MGRERSGSATVLTKESTEEWRDLIGKGTRVPDGTGPHTGEERILPPWRRSDTKTFFLSGVNPLRSVGNEDRLKQ